MGVDCRAGRNVRCVPHPPSGTVTFLFTDIESSTRRWEDNPGAMDDVVARHNVLLRAVIDEHNGVVFATGGDGFAAVFHRVGDALAAAAQAQRELRDEQLSPVRMGIHTGEAVERDGDYFGPTVNRAARLTAIGHGGQVLVSHATHVLVIDALPEGVELVDLGEHRLRDLMRPERVFEARAPGAAESFPRLRSLDAFPGNLPVQLTSFVGRDSHVAAVIKALEESRLVTLTGVGGVGKTRLAVHVSAEMLPRFRDGVWLCELGATNDADLLAQVIVAALGVQPRAARSLTESACDYLSGKQALIVLDNCEHLLDAAAEVTEAILRTAPAVRVLATSREPLGVEGEQLLGVPSLDVASEPSLDAIAGCEAVRLFMDRAGATRSGLQLDATNAGHIVEICRRLDAIPLAIELAAARVTSMSPAEIAGLLDERFRLLTGGRRRGIERHQTLRATVEWSYSLLDERGRTTFDRLGVFAGSFDTDAATAVAGADALAVWDVRDALDDLAAKSMIQPDDGPDGSTRFRLLETLRQYALERLDDTGEAEDYRRRHAAHYAMFAETAGPGLEGPDEAAWFLRFDAELDNLRAAVAWALDADTQVDAELGLRTIAALTRQAFCRPAAGVGEWAEAALERAENSTPGRRSAVLAGAAWKACFESDFDLGLVRGTDALRDGLSPDTPSPGTVYAALAIIYATAGEDDAALQVVAAGRQALDAIGADDSANLFLELTGVVVHVVAGRFDEARGAAEQLLEKSRANANPSLLIAALRWFAGTRRPDEDDAAIRALEECLAHSRAVATPDHPDALQALGLLACLRARRGEGAPAIEALHEAVVRAYDNGQVGILISQLLGYGVSVAADLGTWEFAATLGCALTDGPVAALIYGTPAIAYRDAALDRARAHLDHVRYDAARARGAVMSYEQIVEYTLAELDRL